MPFIVFMASAGGLAAVILAVLSVTVSGRVAPFWMAYPIPPLMLAMIISLGFLVARDLSGIR
jgi:hypothetical protein